MGTGPYDLVPVYLKDTAQDAYGACPVRVAVGGMPVRVVDPAVVGPYGGIPVYLSEEQFALAVESFEGSLDGGIETSSAGMSYFTDSSEFSDTGRSGGIITPTDQDIGFPSETRRVVLVLNCSSNPNGQVISSIVAELKNADGSSAGADVVFTLHKADAGTIGNYVASAVVPYGVLADFTITFDGALFVTPYVLIFTIDDALFEATPTIVDASAAAATSVEATVEDAAENGVIHAAVVWSANIFREHTLTGADVEQGVWNRGVGVSQFQAAGDKTITSTWTGSTDGYMTLVYWPPREGAAIEAPAVANMPDFVVGYCGQSNKANMLTTNAGLESRMWSGTRFWNGSAWVTVEGSGFPSGDGARAMLNRLREYRGGSVGLISLGLQSGTSIAFFRKGQSLYDNALAELIESGGRLDAVCHGAHEADYLMAPATYYAHWNGIHAEWAADAGKTVETLPYFVSGLGPEADAGIDAAAWAAAQIMNENVGLETTVQFSYRMTHAVLSDAIHWDAATYQQNGENDAQNIAAVDGLATPIVNLWTEANLAAALLVDWDPANLANGAVSSFAPEVGGPTPVQATGAAQPVKAATSFNGAYPGLTFDGVDDFLSVDSTTGLPTGATAGEIWMVCTPAVSGAQGSLIAYGATTAGAVSRQVRKSAANFLTMLDGVTTLAWSSGAIAGNPHIIRTQWLPAPSQSLSRDGVAVTVGLANALATGTTRTRMGASLANTPTLFFAGVKGRELVTTALTDDLALRLTGRLAHLYGLTGNLAADHPYKVDPPTL